MTHVLIVDDEPGMGETLQDILGEEGHQVSVALRGREAVEILRETADVDLVLLDMKMPDMNGAEVYRALRELRPELKVVTVSGYSPEDWMDEVLKGGVWATLTKPVDIGRLLELVEQATS